MRKQRGTTKGDLKPQGTKFPRRVPKGPLRVKTDLEMAGELLANPSAVTTFSLGQECLRAVPCHITRYPPHVIVTSIGRNCRTQERDTVTTLG